jgi:hypothetical protein
MPHFELSFRLDHGEPEMRAAIGRVLDALAESRELILSDEDDPGPWMHSYSMVFSDSGGEPDHNLRDFDNTSFPPLRGLRDLKLHRAALWVAEAESLRSLHDLVELVAPGKQPQMRFVCSYYWDFTPSDELHRMIEEFHAAMGLLLELARPPKPGQVIECGAKHPFGKFVAPIAEVPRKARPKKPPVMTRLGIPATLASLAPPDPPELRPASKREFARCPDCRTRHLRNLCHDIASRIALTHLDSLSLAFGEGKEVAIRLLDSRFLRLTARSFEEVEALLARCAELGFREGPKG